MKRFGKLKLWLCSASGSEERPVGVLGPASAPPKDQSAFPTASLVSTALLTAVRTQQPAGSATPRTPRPTHLGSSGHLAAATEDPSGPASAGSAQTTAFTILAISASISAAVPPPPPRLPLPPLPPRAVVVRAITQPTLQLRKSLAEDAGVETTTGNFGIPDLRSLTDPGSHPNQAPLLLPELTVDGQQQRKEQQQPKEERQAVREGSSPDAAPGQPSESGDVWRIQEEEARGAAAPGCTQRDSQGDRQPGCGVHDLQNPQQGQGCEAPDAPGGGVAVARRGPVLRSVTVPPGLGAPHPNSENVDPQIDVAIATRTAAWVDNIPDDVIGVGMDDVSYPGGPGHDSVPIENGGNNEVGVGENAEAEAVAADRHLLKQRRSGAGFLNSALSHRDRMCDRPPISVRRSVTARHINAAKPELDSGGGLGGGFSGGTSGRPSIGAASNSTIKYGKASSINLQARLSAGSGVGVQGNHEPRTPVMVGIVSGHPAADRYLSQGMLLSAALRLSSAQHH